MRTRALNIGLGDDPKKNCWEKPFHDWPRSACKRSLLERALRKIWLFRWDSKRKFFAATGISYHQSQDYRDKKIARCFPIRNWIKEDLPSIINWPKWKLERIYWAVRHRIPGRYWHHTLNLGLPPGYHDADTKILHAVFEVIRTYVEVQLASHISEPEKYKWFGIRSPEAGLAHLEWEIKDCSSGSVGGSGGQLSQGEAAQIKKDVYMWWVNDRPARMDPHDIYNIIDPKRKSTSGRFRQKGLWGLFNNSNLDDRAMWSSMALEEFYKREDQEMLEKAVSILHYWWD